MIGRHVVAASSATVYSVRHAHALRIHHGERLRYLRKSINCALCYVGLGVSGSVQESWRAGRAAFLSTAFDVATDWRHDDPSAVTTFDQLMSSLVHDPDTRQLAARLLRAKQSRQFADDGLERGVFALRLILQVMGCERQRFAEWGDLEPIGETLQLVDDLLDFDQDVARGEMNCLSSPRGHIYLAQFLRRHASGELRRWFGSRRTILVRVVEHAVTQATRVRLPITTLRTLPGP